MAKYSCRALVVGLTEYAGIFGSIKRSVEILASRRGLNFEFSYEFEEDHPFDFTLPVGKLWVEQVMDILTQTGIIPSKSTTSK